MVSEETARWAVTSPSFDALGHRFAIRSTHAGIGRFLTDAYTACEDPDAAPATRYDVLHDLAGDYPHALRIDGDEVVRSARPADVVGHLTWHVNQQVIGRGSDLVLLHAAAVSSDGVAVVLPAPMESGKSTLAAGLVDRGFRYLTDEAAAIDPATLRLRAYPKPLSIDPGSWEVLAHLRPQVDDEVARYLVDQWQLAPARFGLDTVDDDVAVGHVVFPRYEAGAETTLAPIPRSRALVRMLEQTFRFERHGRRDFQALARLLATARVHELVSGDLDHACEAVRRLVLGSDDLAKARR